MLSLREEYERVRDTPSDINEHVETLRNLAAIHNRVVELGTRYGVSTIALLAGQPKSLTCIDLVCQIDACAFSALAHSASVPTEFRFIVGNSLEVEIPNCDLLFIDTFHTGSQLFRELHRHHGRVADTIVMHDTATFGEHGEDGSPGLRFGIQEFLSYYGEHWTVAAEYRNNNGLTILSRTPSTLYPAKSP